MAETPQAFFVGGAENYVVGPTIASAATIAPTAGIHHVSGTATITTITLPWPNFQGTITLIPDGAWSLGTGGNIQSALTAVANTPITLQFDGSKWFNASGSTGAFQLFTPIANGSIAASVIGIGTLDLSPLQLPTNLQASSVYVGLSQSYSATNAGSSRGDTVTVSFGVYSKSGSSLSLASSGTVSTAYTVTGSSSSNSYQGAKLMPVPITINATPGNYWYGYLYSSASAGNAVAGVISNLVASYAGAESAVSGVYGSASTASFQPSLGKGALSVSTASLPAAIAFSDIVTAGNTGQPFVQFVAYTA